MNSTDIPVLPEQLRLHLRAHPEDALRILSAVESEIRDICATDVVPEMIFLPEKTGPDGQTIPAQMLNPRTGKPDVLVAIDTSMRWTDLDPELLDEDAFETLTLTTWVEYDQTADYEGLLYMTQSDGLPVRLPASWSEN